MGSKKDILEKIALGLGKRDTGHEEDIGNVPEYRFSGLPGEISSDHLLQMFITELEKVNGEIRIPEDHNDLEYKLIEIIYSYKIEKCSLDESGDLQHLGLANMLKDRGVTLIDPAEDSEEISKADLGITGVDYAIADTATLVIKSNYKGSRTISLLPPVHVAFLSTDKLVKDIHHLFYIMTRGNERITDLHSSLTFITGPSRTADIELNLTLGVHGPGKLIVFITK